MKVEPAGTLVGHIAVPGDKSISHRAVLIGALCEGETVVRGFGRSGDTQSTVDAVRTLGVEVDDLAHDELVVKGRGLTPFGGLTPAVDCGNAGTLMRLLAGILAGQRGRFELTGDESLRARPMDRIAEPLNRMGAHVTTNPLVIEGSDSLRGIEYALPVASAQVKSAVLLAGLNAAGTTTVIEPAPTRDHTELMLAAAGGSLRDMTRVAGANPRIWVDIFLDNADALAGALAEHRRRVEQVERALAEGDAGFLARWIAEASGNKRRMLAEAYEQPGGLQRLRVHVPDRPGVLAGITQALGAERINIEDFELQHMSRERGGTLTLLVAGEDEAARAAGVLEAQGYHVVVSPVLDE